MPRITSRKRRRRSLSTPCFILSLLLAWSQSVRAGSWFSWKHQSRWKTEGVIPLGSLGMDQVGGRVVAMGDSNGDQIVDLYVLSPDQKTVTLWLWDREAYVFRASQADPIRAPYSTLITNVVPGDYDYDGRLDVLIMAQKNPNSNWDNELQLILHRGLGGGAYDSGIMLTSSTPIQPVVFDASGDMRTHLLAYPKGSTKATDLKLWRNSFGSDNTSTSGFTLTEPPFDVTKACQISHPHSNAFVDLDGDCLADLFLTCVDPSDSNRLTYQIWLNRKSSGFQLARTGRLPPGIGQISFADMDRDGTIDLVFPSCQSSSCHVNIAYNRQMPLCSSDPHQVGPCRNAGALCVADSDFSFSFDDSDAFTQIPLSSLSPEAPYFVLSDSLQGIWPNPIRVADYDEDGFPDLVFISSPKLSSDRGSVAIYANRPCDSASCTNSERRAFVKLTAGTKALNSVLDVRSVALMDVDEDGSLDIVVERVSSPVVQFFKNNFFQDAFFLKALVVNGACERLCQPNVEGQGRFPPYGVSYSGATFKFTVLDPSGVRRATSAVQMPMTSYGSCLTPYAYMGLGRTNNYIERLFVGSTRHQLQHVGVLEGLIPNSQVVIVPWQPGGVQDPSTWSRRLYLHPGDWIPWVTVVIAGAMFVLAVTIIVLHLSEKAVDEAERRKQLGSLGMYSGL